MAEYDTYVAVRDIQIGNALAFNEGDPVPLSHVERGVVSLSDVALAPGGSSPVSDVFDERVAGVVAASGSATAVALRAAFDAQGGPSRRRAGAALPLPPIGTRTCWPLQVSNGTNTGQNTFIQHFIPVGIAEVRFLYVNVYGTTEAAGPNAIPVRAGCQLPDGTVLPVFFRGARTAIIDGGGYVLSDPIAVSQPAYVVSRTYVAVTAGQKWPQGFPDNLKRSVEGAEQGTSITDKSLTGTIASGGATGVNMYGPSAVIGRSAGGDWFELPAIGAVGDSILYGQGDSNFVIGGTGFFERAMNNLHGYVSLGSPTETLAMFNAASGSLIRRALMQGMKAILAQHGRNDVAGGASLATMQSLLTGYWTRLAATGAKVYQTTLTPTSTSTDNWTTAGGQTTDATNTVLSQVNDWIRTTPAPLTGYFDVADAVMTARNSGLWKPDPTTRVVTDAAMTSGSDVLSSATAAFTTDDVLVRRARVVGAGAAGAALVSLIRARTGPTTVNVQVAASTTVSGATATIYIPSTTDGVHPGPYGSAQAATAIDPAVLAAA